MTSSLLVAIKLVLLALVHRVHDRIVGARSTAAEGAVRDVDDLALPSGACKDVTTHQISFALIDAQGLSSCDMFVSHDANRARICDW